MLLKNKMYISIIDVRYEITIPYGYFENEKEAKKTLNELEEVISFEIEIHGDEEDGFYLIIDTWLYSIIRYRKKIDKNINDYSTPSEYAIEEAEVELNELLEKIENKGYDYDVDIIEHLGLCELSNEEQDELIKKSGLKKEGDKVIYY